MKNFKSFVKESFPFGDTSFESEEDDNYIKISHSLLLRLFEYFHENSSSNEDEDIHDIVELISQLDSENGSVDMSDYDYIIGEEESYEDFTEETTVEDKAIKAAENLIRKNTSKLEVMKHIRAITGCDVRSGMRIYEKALENLKSYEDFTEETKSYDEIKREIIKKHAGHFPQEAQDYLHKAKTYGNRAINHLDDHHGIKPGHSKAAIDNIKNEMQARLGNVKTSTNAQRIDRYLSQKWIGPRK